MSMAIEAVAAAAWIDGQAEAPIGMETLASGRATDVSVMEVHHYVETAGPGHSWEAPGESLQALDGDQVRGDLVQHLAEDPIEGRVSGSLGEISIGVVLDQPPDIEPVDRLPEDPVLRRAGSNSTTDDGRADSLSLDRVSQPTRVLLHTGGTVGREAVGHEGDVSERSHGERRACQATIRSA